MANERFISLDDVPAWLDSLAATRLVYAPRREGTAIVYRPHEQGTMPELTARPTESAKHVVFPRSHELFTFSYKAPAEETGQRNISLNEPADPQEAVVFGALSCDARGFFAFDPVYDGCGTKGLAKDVYYLKRREKTAFIVLACRTALNTCFCHWTGGGPANAEGADVLATPVDGGLVLNPMNAKGEGLLSSSLIKTASQEQIQAAENTQQNAEKTLSPLPANLKKPDEIAAAILACFDDAIFWRNQSEACLACGACTYLCPTCYCFTITDESNGLNGVRIRSWDTCMTAQFTLEASGHNPRTEKANRLKNRVGHKFSYYPRLHGGRFSCCGCGRCIKSCPSSVDIRQIVTNAINAATVKEDSNG